MFTFQVVDMRWGVRDESTDDHSTLELCLKELKACQELSTGPNFMVILLVLYSWCEGFWLNRRSQFTNI